MPYTIDVSQELEDIKLTPYGKKMRPALHSSIEKLSKKQNQMAATFDSLIIDAGQSNAEVVAARVDAQNPPTQHTTLKDRLDSDYESVNIRIDDLNNKVDNNHTQLTDEINKTNAQLSDLSDKIKKTCINILDYAHLVVGDDWSEAFQSAIADSDAMIWYSKGNQEGYYSRIISSPTIIVPQKETPYVLKKSLKISTAINIDGVGKPILIGDGTFFFMENGSGKDDMPCAVKVNVSNLCLGNFKGFAELDNNGYESSKHSYHNLDLKQMDYGWKVELDSSIFTVENCQIEGVKWVYVGNSDNAKFKDCWIVQGFLTDSGDATFKPTYNPTTRSKLVLENICGVPQNPATRWDSLGGAVLGVEELAWVKVENTCELYLNNFRGGGELGGCTLVNWKAPMTINGQGRSVYPSILNITNSQGQNSVRTDLDPNDDPETKCCVRLYSLPNILIYKNNFGANQSKYILSVPKNYTKQMLIDACKKAGDDDTGYHGDTNINGLFWDIKNNTSRLQTRPNKEIHHPILQEFVNAKYGEICHYDKTSLEYGEDALDKKITITINAPKWNFNTYLSTKYEAIGIYDISYLASTTGTVINMSYFNYRLAVTRQYKNNAGLFNYITSLTKMTDINGDTRPTNHLIISKVVFVADDDSEHEIADFEFKAIKLYIDYSWSPTIPNRFNMTVKKII